MTPLTDGQVSKAIENIRALGYDCSGWSRQFLADIALAALATMPEYTEQCLRSMTAEGRERLLKELMTYRPQPAQNAGTDDTALKPGGIRYVCRNAADWVTK